MYILKTPAGERLLFSAMAQVLAHLNDHGLSVKYENPYKRNVESTRLEYGGEQFAIVQNHYGVLAPDLSALNIVPSEHLARWLREILPDTLGPDGKGKRPFEITREMWVGRNFLCEAANGQMPVFAESMLRFPFKAAEKQFNNLEHFFCEEYKSLYGESIYGYTYDGHQHNNRHEVHVAYALARGDHVPQHVIDAYATDVWGSMDLVFFKDLIEKPYLRGRFRSVNLLRCVTRILKDEKVEMLEGNCQAIREAIAPLDENATMPQVDNALYAAGIVKPKPRTPPESAAVIGEPFNAFASALRMDLANLHMLTRNADLEKRYAAGNVSLREYERERADNNLCHEREDHRWANQVASALHHKNLEFLLRVLDCTDNETSKRAVELAYNVKLRNVPAAQRRRAIFGLAGYTDEAQYQQAEGNLAREKIARAAARELKDARESAASNRIRLDGGDVMTCDAYVDHLISKGFNRVEHRGAGSKTRYFLFHEAQRMMYPIKKSNGTYQYAKALLAQTSSQVNEQVAQAA